MCKAVSNIGCHICLLSWQIIFAIPAVVLFNNSDPDFPNGLAFFLVVTIIALGELVFVVLVICTYSAYWAYEFIFPFAGYQGGFDAFWAQYGNDSVSTGVAQGWFIVGAIFSCLLCVFSLFLVCNLWYLIRGEKKKAHKEKASKEEREPMLKNNNIQYA